MDFFLHYLENEHTDFFILLLNKLKNINENIITVVNLNMNCEWIQIGDKYKCKYCNFIVPRNTIKRNCSAKNIKKDKVKLKPSNIKSEKPIPSITKRITNFGKAVVKHIKTGRHHCTEEEKQERFSICQSNKCNLFRKYGNGGICAHDDCGCFIRSNGKFLDKLSWADSKCPVGLWNSIEKIVENDKNGV